ncbi:UNVERIFIED_CONTAM: hypothetical protein Sradi_1637900 [Sesamum radiatum]|uniref:Reverse transcriptase zinc-binding domain-containing protein n=1 Tax=Sesamum radiatum TaxID=300843 RepID=A0AAW2UDC6_SESRA
MLTKQLWRLMVHPEKLLSKVLKVRYFPEGDVFTATLGHRPSYTWRSIMAAHALFQAGCRWRVGSGDYIRVWIDPWLPRPRSFRPMTPAPASLFNLRVSDLMIPCCHEWDMSRIRTLFWQEDSDLISSIPLSFTATRDIRIWHYSRSEMFMVRSAYHLAVSLEDRSCSSSLRQHEHTWWRRVWQAKLPNKIKVFIWRVCRNALPTGMALARRLYGSAEPCPFCLSYEEDVLHTLVHCPFARQLTFSFSYAFAGPYGDVGMNSVEVVRTVPNSLSNWVAPPLGHVKINFDGATFRNGRELGIGVVARGASGECLAWLSKRICCLGMES